MKKTAIAVALAISSFTTVTEAVPKNNTWYLGATLGWSQYHDITFYGNSYKNEKNIKINNNLSSFGGFFGYQINPYLSFESGLSSLGCITYKGEKINNYFESYGMQLTSKINYLIIKKFDLYTRLGGMVWYADSKQNEKQIEILHNYDTGISPLFSVGFEYSLSNDIATRLDYQWIGNIGEVRTIGARPNNGLLSLGITYKFNQDTISSEGNSLTSQTVVPIVKDSKQDLASNNKKIIIKTSVLFEFNKSFLRSKGKQILNKLYTEQLKSIDPQKGNLIVLGFSDRIGSYNYNKKLSEKRAKSVVDYLISKGIPSENISSKGIGNTKSITTNICKNIKKRNSLIKCLAPDRRVEIIIKDEKLS